MLLRYVISLKRQSEKTRRQTFLLNNYYSYLCKKQ
nr:MAG TPA: hypothetical protein [Caudoviricetes sp.]DAE70606.1 MAG TPA: hypothetical protein [Caudoviricetes sp.]DAF75911.1 MAG TPA: hypothetical protein [Caudoviricetes sp.]DAG60970.1 MAG TPA: hypothetical protein [Caudoviricetes sp.]DAL84842.1 MAG TPA: hypothetical protein [Caudoviricetes sp.]